MSTKNRSSDTPWTLETKQLPFDRFDCPIAINEKELIVAPYHSHYWQTKGLYKYHTDVHTWSESIAYAPKMRTSFHTTAYDAKNNLLYIYNKEALLIIINLTTQKMVAHPVRHMGKYAASIVIDGELHIIGGWKSNKHLIWDNTQCEFKEVFHFKEAGLGYYLHKLCYMQSRQLLFAMGGYTTTSRASRASDHIYVCEVAKNYRWHLLPVLMPRRMYSFGCVLTPNEKYIVLFGGNSTNHIHIFDLCRQEMVRLERLQCPNAGSYAACVLGNDQKTAVLVAGYVKRCWKSREFEDVSQPPVDIILLLRRYCSTEIVHLFQTTKKQHWRMPLREITSEYELQRKRNSLT